MSTTVGKLYKNKLVRDLNGNIIDWFDEANGGWIVMKRQVVNKEKWEEFLKKQKDKEQASKASTMQKVDPEAPDRTTPPGKLDELEKRMDGFEGKLDAILEAVKGKK